jgi:DNA-binding transcriptional regulator GbsR (MarR family)
MSDLLEKDVKNLREIVKEIKDYKEANEVYKEYKRLKEKLNKPEHYPLDPKRIREDLSSEEFFKFVKSKKIKKKNESRG